MNTGFWIIFGVMLGGAFLATKKEQAPQSVNHAYAPSYCKSGALHIQNNSEEDIELMCGDKGLIIVKPNTITSLCDMKCKIKGQNK